MLVGLSFHSSYEVLSLLLLSIHLFNIWMVVCISCTQKISLNLESFNMVLTISHTTMFFLSTTPFCWGVLVVENCLLIPRSSHKLLNVFYVNAPPLSDLKHFIFKWVSFSTISLNILKHSNASDFFLWKQSSVILV